ncbi:hypothetical protein ACTMU2_00045 [Cupriavidus basilensis]
MRIADFVAVERAQEAALRILEIPPVGERHRCRTAVLALPWPPSPAWASAAWAAWAEPTRYCGRSGQRCRSVTQSVKHSFLLRHGLSAIC